MEYGIDYFYNMLRMYSPRAKDICGIRWAFVEEANAQTVLDYGSGCGFFKAFAPNGTAVDTIDAMPVPQTGITRLKYDLVTFWDVLEHVPNLMDLREVFDMARWVAITVPIKPAKLPWKDYKHFKPGEHIHHFQPDYLCAVLNIFGFDLVKSGTPECPPRSMVSSFLFRRRP